MTASVVFDKTIFKPASVSRIGRFGFQLPKADSAADSGSGTDGSDSRDDAQEESRDDDTYALSDGGPPADTKSEFGFGDFSAVKPAGDEAEVKDEMPMLDGPNLN